MKKIVLLTWVLWIAISVEAIPIAYVGNITTSTTVQSSNLPARFTNAQVLADSSYNIYNSTDRFGSMSLEFVLDSTGGGPIIISQNSETKGNANLQVNAITDVLAVTNLAINAFTDISTWTSQGTGITRNFTYDLMQAGNKIGTLRKTLLLYSVNDSGEIRSTAGKIGDFSVAEQVTLQASAPAVTNLFAGYVKTQNNANYHGQVIAAIGPLIFTTPVSLVGSRTGYGFSGNPLVVTGPLNSTVLFYVNNYQTANVTLTAEQGVKRLDLVVPLRVNNTNFPDADLDGVPDSNDQCQASTSFVVDANGCTCDQIMATRLRGSCEEREMGPVYIPPEPECSSTGQCTGDSPGFCDANKTIVNNCDACGCPSGYECHPCPEGETCIQDGGCYKILEPGEITGLKCFKNKYQIGSNLDCTTLGPTFVDIIAVNEKTSLLDFITVRASGNVFADDDEVEHEVKRKLAPMRICVDTYDLGCVSSEVKCLGEEKLAKYSSEVAGILQTEVNNMMGDQSGSSGYWGWQAGFSTMSVLNIVSLFLLGPWAVPGIISALSGLVASFITDVDIDFAVNHDAVASVKLRQPYACERVLVQPTECKPYMINGDTSSKFDMVFINDGFEEFEPTLAKLLDYNANSTATQNEGLFSREPFKRTKSKFNVWTVKASLNYAVDEFHPSKGEQPDAASVYAALRDCDEVDAAFVVSKSAAYSSDCTEESPGYCSLSIPAEQLPGRQLLRLAGKKIGGLADEYAFEIRQVDNPNRVEGFEMIGEMPNCKKNLNSARTAWGNLLSASGQTIGFYKGCRGECMGCSEFIKPTFNSPMRNASLKCFGGSCTTGPPYDPFYLVNENAIYQAIQSKTS